jgi:hypothetical protein
MKYYKVRERQSGKSEMVLIHGSMKDAIRKALNRNDLVISMVHMNDTDMLSVADLKRRLE